jgi:hypothetical protein
VGSQSRAPPCCRSYLRRKTRECVCAIPPREPGRWWRHAPLRPRLDNRHDHASGVDGHRHPSRHRGREPSDAQRQNPRGISKSRICRRAPRISIDPPARKRPPGFRSGAPRRTPGSSGASRRDPALSRSHLPTAPRGHRRRDIGSRTSRSRPAAGRLSTMGLRHRRWREPDGIPSQKNGRINQAALRCDFSAAARARLVGCPPACRALYRVQDLPR